MERWSCGFPRLESEAYAIIVRVDCLFWPMSALAHKIINTYFLSVITSVKQSQDILRNISPQWNRFGYSTRTPYKYRIVAQKDEASPQLSLSPPVPSSTSHLFFSSRPRNTRPMASTLNWTIIPTAGKEAWLSHSGSAACLIILIRLM